ncbi:hypothetical protein K438DRAFT_1815679 [Mycena galopus ATCC 62051]|nr:hypothetical protein K438DRAFT_1815679 [Mycena galopus ATCC 62051]
MAHSRPSTNDSPALPPINVLFAEVLQRQLAQPSAPPVRRPSAWPGFPGPDKNALSASSGYPHASGYPHTSPPPPPLQVGRRPSASAASSQSLDVLSSPSIFPNLHARGDYSTSDNNGSHQGSLLFAEAQERESSSHQARRGSYAQPSHSPAPFRTRPQSWSEPRPPQPEARETGRLPPIAMATGSPRLYEREKPRPRVRESTCQHYRRATVTARGPTPSESPYAPKQQIPTPLPPSHGHTMIPFQPTSDTYAGRAFGVSMADILDFRSCLKDPDTPVLDNGVEQIFLTLEAKGYSTFVQAISGNCSHRRISRFNLAYAVASAFDSFLKDFPFNPSGLKAAAIVVRSVAELRLVNLYSRDGRVWRVHVAYCMN